MKQEPVYVTGIGAITPIGSRAEGLWNGAMTGKSAVQKITRFDPSPFVTHIAAEVNDFDPEQHLNPKQIRRMDRYSQFAIASARMALEDADLNPSLVNRDRVGVCLGTALGGIGYAEEQHQGYFEKGTRGVSPLLALSVFAGAGSCNISIEWGFTGPSTANGDSCASAPVAIGNALHYLWRGEADVMLAGGAEAPLSPLSFGAFALIRAMSQRNDEPETASRPFDKDRDGFVMGEGAAILVLETRSHAERRGAVPYAEIVSYALSNDGHHMTAPRADGTSATRAVREAMERAGLSADEIVAISAHGSSTPLNDSTETRALKAALGAQAERIPIFGTKGMHAHALGATGAFEAALCCMAMRHGKVPGTANCFDPDPECDLDYVREGCRAISPGPILSNSFGFGGINACLAFKPVA
ncbi:MAG: beta-ketoacyl-ACP synthase II [Armatimonadaceae bacterium]